MQLGWVTVTHRLLVTGVMVPYAPYPMPAEPCHIITLLPCSHFGLPLPIVSHVPHDTGTLSFDRRIRAGPTTSPAPRPQQANAASGAAISSAAPLLRLHPYFTELTSLKYLSSFTRRRAELQRGQQTEAQFSAALGPNLWWP